jgi:hypothetical protein
MVRPNGVSRFQDASPTAVVSNPLVHAYIVSSLALYIHTGREEKAQAPHELARRTYSLYNRIVGAFKCLSKH